MSLNKMIHLEERVAEYDLQIATLSKQNETCVRLMTVPGVGPMVATALVASVADAKVFKSGREMAAWLGLVPRQHTTGGKPKLMGISKRGDTYLRKLVIHGARSALRCTGKKYDKRSVWATSLKERRGHNIAAVALANKTIRTAWVLITRNENYQMCTARI